VRGALAASSSVEEARFVFLDDELRGVFSRAAGGE
jgi:hypothetical protein